ncbi:4492_t:CDS:2 [Ambispora gerdemannii]|uniref:4492_t:CDS:1 n=1 Tax=Ambispora gerdemannii TaxID=144530 RepID=A0A9N8ZGX4_9GLOM|nr:4492_t:CDS:2 [Ambispora gerdemannii]
MHVKVFRESVFWEFEETSIGEGLYRLGGISFLKSGRNVEMMNQIHVHYCIISLIDDNILITRVLIGMEVFIQVYMEIIGEGLQRLIDPLSYTIIIKMGMILAIMVGIIAFMRRCLCSSGRNFTRAKVDEKDKRLDNNTALPALGLGFNGSGSNSGGIGY